MVFDMHCHTSEGSPDAQVGLIDTISLLKKQGYDGMLVTDHNSYRGYNSLVGKPSNFVVLRGVEYDTLDGGHMLIILPSRINYEIFEYRGMLITDVIKIVHVLGGIIGPAHPYDYSKLGVCNTKFGDNPEVMAQFDFVETFNGCLNKRGSILATELAREYNKPCFGGSDSHKSIRVGLGHTEIKQDIFTEDDLISAVQASNFTSFVADGKFFEWRVAKLHSMGVVTGGATYSLLNRCLSHNYKKKAALIFSALGLDMG